MQEEVHTVQIPLPQDTVDDRHFTGEQRGWASKFRNYKFLIVVTMNLETSPAQEGLHWGVPANHSRELSERCWMPHP